MKRLTTLPWNYQCPKAQVLGTKEKPPQLHVFQRKATLKKTKKTHNIQTKGTPVGLPIEFGCTMWATGHYWGSNIWHWSIIKMKDALKFLGRFPWAYVKRVKTGCSKNKHSPRMDTLGQCACPPCVSRQHWNQTSNRPVYGIQVNKDVFSWVRRYALLYNNCYVRCVSCVSSVQLHQYYSCDQEWLLWYVPVWLILSKQWRVILVRDNLCH